ncbi:MAG: ABC transporter permease [Chloroflexi bacterium]|nr:ABC transporter permease [Chloroflexota bacterium]
MAQATLDRNAPESFIQRVRPYFTRLPVIYWVMALLLVFIYIRTPNFFTPNSLIAFIRNAAPLIVIAIGQMFVLVSGEIDLSVGSLITVAAALAAKVIDSDNANIPSAVLIIVLVTLAVALTNGIVTTFFKVPSFVTTLAMLLIAQGIISIVTGGAAGGGLTPEFRALGRGNVGDTNIPIALIVTLLIYGLAVIIMQFTTLGRNIYAVGSNPAAAALSGVRVGGVKIMAFILCSCCAAMSAVLLVGFSGMSSLQVGSGKEFQAISAAVLGGVALTGGRGGVTGAVAGALTLELLFRFLNLLSLPLPYRLTVQGLIILGAVAASGYRGRNRQ